MSNTPTQLGSIITDPRARSIVYRIGALFGIVLGATNVAFGVIAQGQPTWLAVTNAVFAFLGLAGLGGLATANTDTPATLERRTRRQR